MSHTCPRLRGALIPFPRLLELYVCSSHASPSLLVNFPPLYLLLVSTFMDLFFSFQFCRVYRDALNGTVRQQVFKRKTCEGVRQRQRVQAGGLHSLHNRGLPQEDRHRSAPAGIAGETPNSVRRIWTAKPSMELKTPPRVGIIVFALWKSVLRTLTA